MSGIRAIGGTGFASVCRMAVLPVVAVINTNPDLVELLKARIEAAGFIVLVMHIADIRAARKNARAVAAKAEEAAQEVEDAERALTKARQALDALN